MPESSRDTEAVLSLIGRSLGFDVLPLPQRGPRLPLMGLGEAAEVVGEGRAIAPPATLELTAHLSRQGVGADVLKTVATPLFRQSLGRENDNLDMLLTRLASSRRGEDALGRNFKEKGDFGDVLIRSLVASVQQTTLAVQPSCEARTKTIGRYPVLSLATRTETVDPLVGERDRADPRQWPRTPGQSAFFRSMDPVSQPTPLSTPPDAPDDGWSARLREVVDFSFGIDGSGSSLMTTDLDILYFERASAVGCTYDLGATLDGKIAVDRGYVLIEDLASVGFRRVTTLKEVYFRSRPQPGDVCEFWSMALGIAASLVPPSQESVPGSAP